jgi:hypothetical protein
VAFNWVMLLKCYTYLHVCTGGEEKKCVQYCRGGNICWEVLVFVFGDLNQPFRKQAEKATLILISCEYSETCKDLNVFNVRLQMVYTVRGLYGV